MSIEKLLTMYLPNMSTAQCDKFVGVWNPYVSLQSLSNYQLVKNINSQNRNMSQEGFCFCRFSAKTTCLSNTYISYNFNELK